MHGAGTQQLLEWVVFARAMDGVASIHFLVPVTSRRVPTGRVVFRQHSRLVKVASRMPIEAFLQVQDALLELAGKEPGDSGFTMFDRPVELPVKDGAAQSANLSMAPYNHPRGSVFYSSALRLLPDKPGSPEPRLAA